MYGRSEEIGVREHGLGRTLHLDIARVLEIVALQLPGFTTPKMELLLQCRKAMLGTNTFSIWNQHLSLFRMSRRSASLALQNLEEINAISLVRSQRRIPIITLNSMNSELPEVFHRRAMDLLCSPKPRRRRRVR